MSPVTAGRLGAAWAALLPVAMLGPALAPGYVLSYDMVWVPDLALRADALGTGPALPRAVPSDAVVAILDELVPGMLLQKLVLLGALVLAGLGARRLAPAGSALAALAATTAYVVSPFVVERAVLGHWPLLLTHAALPWLWWAGRRRREDGALPWWTAPVLLAGSLSASGGLVAGLVLAASAWRGRVDGRLLLLLLAANAPWIGSGVLHAGTATSTSAGSVFGLGGEGPFPGPLAALTLGGIWNAEVVPDSRRGVLAVLALVLLVAAAVLGARRFATAHPWRDRVVLLVLAVVGYVGALVTWAAPGVVGRLAGAVPGGGLLRDGSRLLDLAAPLLAALVAAAVAVLADRAGRLAHAGPRVALALVAGLLPLALLPEAVWGFGGALGTASYPDDWADARTVLADAPGDGDVLVLPFTPYRAPAWNDGRKVLDPLPRFQPRDAVASDRLRVDGEELAGEDPRGPEVLAALAAPTPEERSSRLVGLGIGLVARDLTTTPGAPYDAELAGEVLVAGPTVEVLALPGSPARRDVPTSWLLVTALTWAAYAGAWLLGPALLVTRRGTRSGFASEECDG